VPDHPGEAIDPRYVGFPELIAEMLVYCSRTQGPRFVTFFDCMYYATMRPSEVAALTRASCYLPGQG